MDVRDSVTEPRASMAKRILMGILLFVFWGMGATVCLAAMLGRESAHYVFLLYLLSAGIAFGSLFFRARQRPLLLASFLGTCIAHGALFWGVLA